MVMPQMGPKKAEVDQKKQKKKQLLKRLVVKVGVDQRKQRNQRKKNLQRRLKMVMMPKRQQWKVKRDLNKHLEAEKLIVLQFFIILSLTVNLLKIAGCESYLNT